MSRKALLICGVISSLLYVGADLLAAVLYPGYHSFTSQAISELAAVGAPTKGLVDPLFIAYDILVIAFGVGVWRSAGRKRALRLVGGLLVGIGMVGLVAMPFTPMKLRGTGNLSTDAPHIAVTAVIVLFIFSAIGLGASLFGRQFRLYSYATLLTLLVFGAWTGAEAARLAAQQPTPWLGVVERIHIGAYLLWVLVLAMTLLRVGIPVVRGDGLEAFGRPHSPIRAG
jgi:hypothetical membrane protein